jgi:hypothetical protein
MDLDAYLVLYNTNRPHQGRTMRGRAPYTVFKASLPKPKRAGRTERKKAAMRNQPGRASVR